MPAFFKAIDAFSDRVGRTVSWLLWLMAILSVAVVILRYAFGIGGTVLQESVIYLHATLFMVGAAYTLRHNEHVRVDILNQRFSPRTRALVEIGGTVIFLLPVCGFLFWTSIDYVLASWRVHETSTDDGLPFVYVLKTLLLVMPVLLSLQGLAEIARNAAFLSGTHPELYPDVQHHEKGEL